MGEEHAERREPRHVAGRRQPDRHPDHVLLGDARPGRRPRAPARRRCRLVEVARSPSRTTTSRVRRGRARRARRRRPRAATLMTGAARADAGPAGSTPELAASDRRARRPSRCRRASEPARGERHAGPLVVRARIAVGRPSPAAAGGAAAHASTIAPESWPSTASDAPAEAANAARQVPAPGSRRSQRSRLPPDRPAVLLEPVESTITVRLSRPKRGADDHGLPDHALLHLAVADHHPGALRRAGASGRPRRSPAPTARPWPSEPVETSTPGREASCRGGPGGG